MRRLLIAALIALPAAGHAARPDLATTRPVAEALLAHRPSPPITGMTAPDDGLCAQVQFVSVLVPHWGSIAGGTVGLTSAPVPVIESGFLPRVRAR